MSYFRKGLRGLGDVVTPPAGEQQTPVPGHAANDPSCFWMAVPSTIDPTTQAWTQTCQPPGIWDGVISAIVTDVQRIFNSGAGQEVVSATAAIEGQQLQASQPGVAKPKGFFDKLSGTEKVAIMAGVGVGVVLLARYQRGKGRRK